MKKKGPILLLTILLVGAGIFVLSVGVAGTIYSSSSDFCNSCHEMSTRHASWTRSTHKDVECMACHSGTGLGGYIEAKWGGARRLVVHYFGEVGQMHAEVKDDVCLSCHFDSKEDQMSLQKEISPIHITHFKDASISCLDCHDGMVHGSLEGGIPIERQQCVDCHVAEKVRVDLEYE